MIERRLRLRFEEEEGEEDEEEQEEEDKMRLSRRRRRRKDHKQTRVSDGFGLKEGDPELESMWTFISDLKTAKGDWTVKGLKRTSQKINHKS